MQAIEKIQRRDYTKLMEDLRLRKLADAERAIAQEDFVFVATLFETIALLSKTLGDILVAMEFERLAKAIKARLGIIRDNFDETIAKTKQQAKRIQAWKTYLASLQVGALEAFARKNYKEARYHVARMVSIVENCQLVVKAETRKGDSTPTRFGRNKFRKK
jgi:hypothetical protein